MWEAVSSCPRCGAPIWARAGWISEDQPPPHWFSCDCSDPKDEPAKPEPVRAFYQFGEHHAINFPERQRTGDG